jgi:gentisate 1,2-dioxygenase
MQVTQDLPIYADTTTAYQRWQQSEGIPIYSAMYLEDLNTLKLGPWKRRGISGAYINLADQEMDDAYVAEIPPKGQTNAENHMFEETIFILSGRGTTSITNPDGTKLFFEWGKGSLFAVPLNCTHQHFNSDGSKPARYVAVTDAPLVQNLFHDVDFLLRNPFQFKERFSSNKESWKGEGSYIARWTWETNFVPDVLKFQLTDMSVRGKGNNAKFEFADNTMAAHVSEFPVGTYKKAHRHGPGAHIVILSGTGYSLMWQKGEKKERYNWKPGSMISPPDMWYHQHFNTGKDPVRYLALRFGSVKHLMGKGFMFEYGEAGDQIEYKDEDPEVRRMFEEELAKNGVKSDMPQKLP